MSVAEENTGPINMQLTTSIFFDRSQVPTCFYWPCAPYTKELIAQILMHIPEKFHGVESARLVWWVGYRYDCEKLFGGDCAWARARDDRCVRRRQAGESIRLSCIRLGTPQFCKHNRLRYIHISLSYSWEFINWHFFVENLSNLTKFQNTRNGDHSRYSLEIFDKNHVLNIRYIKLY